LHPHRRAPRRVRRHLTEASLTPTADPSLRWRRFVTAPHRTGYVPSATVLEMRTTCERCGASLDADGPAAICSYECTFCASCSDPLADRCPNCGADLVPRPRRAMP